MGTKTFDKAMVLGLYTETSLHCGSESAAGYVDLPVQRERHTGFPVIPGSTIKGVLKDELDVDKVDVFGKQDSPGQVSFGDGMLVAFPVRSSHHPFHWITCPFVLERLFRAIGIEIRVEDPGKGNAWAKDEGEVLLEELVITKGTSGALFPGSDGAGLNTLLRLLPPDKAGFAYTRACFPARLLVLNDDDFRELVETGTEVVTRIKLNIRGTTTTIKDKDKLDEIKKELRTALDRDANEAEIREASQGNMFVEEVVPPETLFFATLRSLKPDLLDADKMPTLIRLGGDETIGRGLTHVTAFREK